MDHVSILSNRLQSRRARLARNRASKVSKLTSAAKDVPVRLRCSCGPRQPLPQLLQLTIAPIVPRLADQPFGFREIADCEVVVGEEENACRSVTRCERLRRDRGACRGQGGHGERLWRPSAATASLGLSLTASKNFLLECAQHPACTSFGPPRLS
jgi:hypothetical protein